MSLDKSIEHKKEKRKPYHGSKSIDPTCRNHGGCPWCEENRKHKYRKREESARSQLEDLESLESMPFAPTEPENFTQ